jgi:hypothetical protein
VADLSLTQDLILQLVVMLAAGGLLCWAAQRLKLSRVAGGILAGLLIGPVLLAVHPDAHTDLLHNTRADQQKLAQAEADLLILAQSHQKNIEALQAIDVTESYWRSEQKRMEQELADKRTETIAPIRERIDSRQSQRADGRLMFFVIAAVVVFFCAGAHSPLTIGSGAGIAALAGVGAAAAGCAILSLMFQSMTWLAGAGAAVGCAVGCLPFEKPVADPLGEDRSMAASAVAYAMGLGLIGGLALTVAGTDTSDAGLAVVIGIGLTALATLAALKLGRPSKTLVVPAVAAILAAALAGPTWAIWAAALAGLLLVAEKEDGFSLLIGRVAEPLVLVYAGMQLNPTLIGNWWIPILLIVVFGDVRAVAVMMIVRWRGASWPRSMLVGTAFVRGGATTVVLAIGLLKTGLIGAEIYAGLLLACFATSLVAAPLMTAIGRAYKTEDPPSPSGDTAD